MQAIYREKEKKNGRRFYPAFREKINMVVKVYGPGGNFLPADYEHPRASPPPARDEPSANVFTQRSSHFPWHNCYTTHQPALGGSLPTCTGRPPPILNGAATSQPALGVHLSTYTGRQPTNLPWGATTNLLWAYTDQPVLDGYLPTSTGRTPTNLYWTDTYQRALSSRLTSFIMW